MPYGIPWTSAVGYRCVECNSVHTQTHYMPYCGLCGAKQPDEEELKELGLELLGPTAGKRSTRDIDEIRAFLTQHHGKPIRIWNYCVSHCELELRLRHSGEPCKNDEPWLNTVIYCGGTRLIRLPTSAWESAVEIGVEAGKYGDVFVLTDSASSVRVECDVMRLYFDVEPGY